MNFTEFLNQNVYIVSVVLFIIGLFLKKTPRIPSWSVPYILSVLGIISCNLILTPGIDATLQGFLSAGISVYAYQLYKEGKTCINNVTEQKKLNNNNKN